MKQTRRILFTCVTIACLMLFCHKQNANADTPNRREVTKPIPPATPDAINARRAEIITITKLYNSDNPNDIQRATMLAIGGPGGPINENSSARVFCNTVVRCADNDGNKENKRLIDNFVRSIARAADKHPGDVGVMLWSVTELALKGRYPKDAERFWSPDRARKSEEWWLNSALHAALTKP